MKLGDSSHWRWRAEHERMRLPLTGSPVSLGVTMRKSLLAILVIAVMPIASFGAVPMTMNEDNGAVAEPNMPIAASAPVAVSDPRSTDVDESREMTPTPSDDDSPAIAAPRSNAQRTVAHPQDGHTSRPDKRAPATTKGHDGTRWQSLLPGVMQ
jgi:hypothetical protein